MLNFRYCLVNKYLAKRFLIIENNSNQLISPSNDSKLRIHAIDQLETDLVMKKNTAIFSVANTIKKLHIMSNLQSINRQNFYQHKQDEMDEIFDEYHITILKIIYHPALIE